MLLVENEAAIECYDSALEIDHKFVVAWANKGIVALAISVNTNARSNAAQAAINGVHAHSILMAALINMIEKKRLSAQSSHSPAARAPPAILVATRPRSNATTKPLSYPKYAFAWANKGVARYRTSVKTTWRSSASTGLEVNPNFTFAWFSKGIAFINLDRKDVADRVLRQGTQDRPDVQIRVVQQGQCARQPRSSRSGYRVLRQGTRDRYEVHLRLGRKGCRVSNLGRNFAAIECCDNALEIDPKCTLAWFRKGNAFTNLNQTGAALECYDKALEIDPKALWRGPIRASPFSVEVKSEAAIQCYDKALDIDPKQKSTWVGKGLTLANLNYTKPPSNATTRPSRSTRTVDWPELQRLYTRKLGRTRRRSSAMTKSWKPTRRN